MSPRPRSIGLIECAVCVPDPAGRRGSNAGLYVAVSGMPAMLAGGGAPD